MEGTVSDVTVHNTAERPVYQVYVVGRHYAEEVEADVEGAWMIEHVLAAGQQTTDTSVSAAPAVIFTDADGNSWVRDLSDQSLSRHTKRRDHARVQRGVRLMRDVVGDFSDDKGHRFTPPATVRPGAESGI
ncbi:hypothetical protein [Streptomyces inhibens]|uniref:hypothetical protein n=1 Tax=Streptomyces inhibens TaxID=2293571 RepID=UPI001EE74C2E|nr:hypothetical protein [Streptomyces inhibens]UKY53297.1 hypothetical protein KI385_33820 [Streptomyces inhibens]